MKREDIYRAIDAERVRQEELHPGWPWEGEATQTHKDRAKVLTDEVEEVWFASSLENSKEELIHVASVAVRWLESME